MKLSKTKLEIVLAESCKSFSDLRGTLSSATMAKWKKDPGRDMSPRTIGLIARVLGVPVEDIIEQES